MTNQNEEQIKFNFGDRVRLTAISEKDNYKDQFSELSKLVGTLVGFLDWEDGWVRAEIIFDNLSFNLFEVQLELVTEDE